MSTGRPGRPDTKPMVLTPLLLPPPLHRRLKRDAQARGISMAALIRELLTLGLVQRTEEAA